MDFIIGYGSLMNRESRRITGPSAQAIPVMVKGFARSWGAVYDELRFCALSVQESHAATFNAVLFEAVDLAVWDEREFGYTRTEVPRAAVSEWSPSANAIPANARIWIYIPNDVRRGQPSDKNLIWETYLQVCVSGCLEYGDSFAADFFKSTSNWQPEFIAQDSGSAAYVNALTEMDIARVNSFIGEYGFSPRLFNVQNASLAAHVQKRLQRV